MTFQRKNLKKTTKNHRNIHQKSKNNRKIPPTYFLSAIFFNFLLPVVLHGISYFFLELFLLPLQFFILPPFVHPFFLFLGFCQFFLVFVSFCEVFASFLLVFARFLLVFKKDFPFSRLRKRHSDGPDKKKAFEGYIKIACMP